MMVSCCRLTGASCVWEVVSVVVRLGLVRIALLLLVWVWGHPSLHLPRGMLININCLRSFILLLDFRSCLHRSATAAPNGS